MVSSMPRFVVLQQLESNSLETTDLETDKIGASLQLRYQPDALCDLVSRVSFQEML